MLNIAGGIFIAVVALMVVGTLVVQGCYLINRREPLTPNQRGATGVMVFLFLFVVLMAFGYAADHHLLPR